MSSISKFACHMAPRSLKEPFRTSLRTVSHFDVIEFRVETDDGLQAIGEAVETPVITGDTQEMILDGLLGPIKEALEGISFSSPLELVERIANTSAVSSAKAAADMALYYLESAGENKTLAEVLGSTRPTIASDVTIPIADLANLEQIVLERLKDGFNSFKVKLAMEPIENSIQKLELLLQMVGQESVIRVDPNQSWSVAHSLNFLEEIDRRGISIDYLEQPTPADDKRALAEIKRNTQTRIMADESCFDMEDLLQLIEYEAVDLINLKLLKSGGISPSLQMAEVAREAGIGILVGSMMEGDRGVFASACLADALAPDEIHDLDASWWAMDSRINYRDGQVLLR